MRKVREMLFTVESREQLSWVTLMDMNDLC